MALFGSLGEINVGALSATTTDNAVDVFVYDTRKDSDGGQWRKRTQHTSWYNETLNTATRGSRRDFPAVAVLVLETGKLTIYDGDDPDMPMWMIFNTTDGSMLRSGVMTSIVMMNGEFWVGHDSGSGLHWVNFLKDTARWITASSSYGGFFKKTSIIFRNDAGANYDNNIGGASDVFIAGSSIKDLAMTVLPNAPIDSATGLPVPTVAVATESGVSVIKDDGTIESNSDGYIYAVGFISNDRIAYGHRGGYFYAGRASTIAPIRNTIQYGYYIHNTIPSFGNSDLDAEKITGVGDNNVYAYAQNGIRRINENITSSTNGMANYITTSYNTGWMHGNIKGAWLSDTSTASVTGTELITNGTFDSNTTGWNNHPQYSSTVLSIDTNRLKVLGGGAQQSFSTVIGKTYVVVYTLTAFNPGGIYLGTEASGTASYNYFSTGAQETGTYSYYFTATSTTAYITLFAWNIGTQYAFYDNVSVRLIAEADRSVNNKGLAVYGTITKSPVATGSNLVAYSGWSNSNYLRRPAGVTDLNNSSITYMCWYKGGGYNGEEAPVSTGDYDVINRVRGIYINPSGIAGFSGWANDFNPGSFNVRDYIWHHICVTIQYISGTTYTISVYVDGRLTGSTNRELSTFTNTAIDVGGGTLPGTRYTIGSLSLVRVSTTIPSSEQIKKIYEDEKVLFQPNSQCTLFGSSDVVTALAYDDTYQILSVGTSSGRSDFRGLERINNTTTAVTTAISASNGLIAEQ
jgi:hypothetical protein